MATATRPGYASEQISPFPPRRQGPTYFEVTLSDADAASIPKGTQPAVTVGFCGEFSNMTNAYAGWIAWSVCYHGADSSLTAGLEPPAGH
jgi:hypothetical protein